MPTRIPATATTRTVTSPVVTHTDLGVLLKDDTIDQTRADALIADATTLCATIVSPLPASAAVVIKRVAARAYVSTVSPRGPQMGMSGSPFGAGQPGSTTGGVVLYKSDIRDLRRLAGGSSAFSVDTLDPAYVLPPSLPYWDAETIIPGSV